MEINEEIKMDSEEIKKYKKIIKRKKIKIY